MKYTKVRLFLIAACCCVASLAGNTANAGWGLLHGGGSSGGYGSYGAGYGSSGGAGYGSSGGAVSSFGSSGGYASYSYGSSGGGSSGGSSGGIAYGSSGHGHGPGPLRRFAAHIHDHMAAKHARRAAYGSSGGSSGSYVTSYGSSGGSSGSYIGSYGSSGGYGSSGYSTSYGSSGSYSSSYGSSGGYSASYGSTGSTYSSGYLGVSNQSPTAAASLVADESDAIFLNVSVPASAKVYVNDMPTTSTGVSRQYVSRGLEAGKNYKFELRAEVVGADGQVAKETKLVTLTAGQKEAVKFVSLEETRVQTVVTLNVPADAKVILAGNETSATGETRTFRTSQLKAGDRWDDYVVEVEHAGKIKRESLRLVAGDEVSLTFNFDDDKSLVASR